MRKFGAILVYIFVLLYVIGFRFWELIDIKGLLLVIMGTVLLTLAGYQKGIDKEGIKEMAGFNAMASAYLTMLITLLSQHNTHSLLEVERITLALRPVLYGYIIQIILQDKPAKIKAGNAEEIKCGETHEITLSLQGADILKQLTEREREIALLVKKGFSNREIGKELFISEATVKKHMSNIFEKLGIANREQLKNLL